MKQKPDESLDQWVRQSLSRLPDTPPSGSSFDPERLWQQLRPELQAELPRRRVSWVWWSAAAVIAGIVTLWGSMYWRESLPASALTVKKTKQVTSGPATLSMGAEKPVKSVPELENEKRNAPDVASKQVKTEKINPRQQVDAHSEVVATVDLSESESDGSRERGIRPPGTLENTLPELETQAPIAQNVPKSNKVKRHFKVVHENELQAEEEAMPKLYQTGNFVRLGTGQIQETEQQERQPSLVLPLTNKPNQ